MGAPTPLGAPLDLGFRLGACACMGILWIPIGGP
jgi:hypothetical protein